MLAEHNVQFVQPIERRVGATYLQTVELDAFILTERFRFLSVRSAFSRRLGVFVATSSSSATSTPTATLALRLTGRSAPLARLAGAFAGRRIERKVNLVKEEFVNDRALFNGANFVRIAAWRLLLTARIVAATFTAGTPFVARAASLIA